MQYGRTIVSSLPLMVAAAVASAYLVSLQQALMGYAIGIMTGLYIGHRGVQLLRSHITQRKRKGFGPMPRTIGALVFFVSPLIAGIAMGLLYQFQPGLVATAVVAGTSSIATWWIVMGCWVVRIERRSGRKILLCVDGFHLSSVDQQE